MQQDGDDNDEDFEMLFNPSGVSDPTGRSEALFEQCFTTGSQSSMCKNLFALFVVYSKNPCIRTHSFACRAGFINNECNG